MGYALRSGFMVQRLPWLILAPRSQFISWPAFDGGQDIHSKAAIWLNGEIIERVLEPIGGHHLDNHRTAIY